MDQFLEHLLEVISITNPTFSDSIRLPSERDLVAALGVNRSTLRERMAILEAMGFLNRSQGSGTYLAMPKSQLLQLTFEMALKMKYTSIEQIEATREAIEIGMAKSAAENATDEDIKAIEYFLNRLLETTDREYGRELDHAFHMHIGAATHNPVMIMVLDSFSSSLRKVLQVRRHIMAITPKGLERTNQTHIAIFEAIRDHDPERATKAMEQHFSVWQEIATISSTKDVEGTKVF